MKAVIEKVAKLLTSPVWVAVDKKTETLTETIVVNGKQLKHHNKKESVRCNIGVIDYQSKAEAMYIAGVIQRAIEAAPAFKPK